MSFFSALSSALGGGPTFRASGGGPGYQGPTGGSFNWPLMAMMLGQMGSAISPRNSWQQRLGGAASGWARSNIYANAASKVQPNFDDYIKYVLGGGVTPPGTPGPTAVTADKNGDVHLQITPTQQPNPMVNMGNAGSYNATPTPTLGAGSFPFSAALLG